MISEEASTRESRILQVLPKGQMFLRIISRKTLADDENSLSRVYSTILKIIFFTT